LRVNKGTESGRHYDAPIVRPTLTTMTNGAEPDPLTDIHKLAMMVDRNDGYGPNGDQPTTGRLERQVRTDIASMGTLAGGARASFAEMAYLLAATLDRAYLDTDTAPSVLANLHK
jgi:hypothetical protein